MFKDFSISIVSSGLVNLKVEPSVPKVIITSKKHLLF